MNVLRLLSMTFVFLKVFGDSLQASKPDVTHISFFRNALVGSNITLMLFFFVLWLVLPIRERKNFIRFSQKHIIVWYLQIFNL